MDVEYDGQNDLFLVDGRQVFWSSVYVLRRHDTGKAKLMEELEISASEVPIFESELRDLAELGFIHRDFSKKVRATKRGLAFLHKASRAKPVKRLQRRAVRDVDEVREESDDLLRMDIHGTKLLVPEQLSKPDHIRWFNFFLNSFTGLFLFSLVLWVTYSALGNVSLDVFLLNLIYSPVLALFASLSLTVLTILAFDVGRDVNSVLFRR
ncbi:MAG: hypothetical protein JW834_04495 [Candidatus Diapherotrites archaeon]|nr:hypothetical protein [Candidatus Diapherotrites archaeon]